MSNTFHDRRTPKNGNPSSGPSATRRVGAGFRLSFYFVAPLPISNIPHLIALEYSPAPRKPV
jgi:hypothetical protein